MEAIFITFAYPVTDDKLEELIAYFGKRNIVSSSSTYMLLHISELNEDDINKITRVTATETIINTEYNCSTLVNID